MFQDKDLQRTPLSEIGEFGMIDRIQSSFKNTQPTTQLGIGDDCAIIDYGEKAMLISTDMLTEGVHFNLAYVPLKHLGYKAIASSVSDVCAMNALPQQVLVSFAVSDRFPVEAIDELFAGMLIACQKYEVDLVGGDTTASKAGLVINVTAIGSCDKEKIVTRKGARENDLLVVSGDLGSAYFGLQILERENEVYKVNPNVQPDLRPYDYLIGRQLKPEARLDIIKLLEKLNVKPTAMIDVSDGLASEILHLSQQSKVGFTLDEEKIPLDQQVISAGEEFELNASIAALNGGEDYELLFTIKQEDYDKIKGNPHFTVIGFANDLQAGNHLVARGSNIKIPLTSQGWDAFYQYQKNVKNAEEK